MQAFGISSNSGRFIEARDRNTHRAAWPLKTSIAAAVRDRGRGSNEAS